MTVLHACNDNVTGEISCTSVFDEPTGGGEYSISYTLKTMPLIMTRG